MYRIELNLTDMDNIERLNIINMTIANFSDQEIIESDAFGYWFDDNVDLEDHQECDENDDYIELTEEELNDVKLESVQEFKDSEGFYSLQEDYDSMTNSLHILQNEPTAEEIQLITKYAPNVTVYGIEEFGAYGLSLNGCGMDMSDLLALAYFIVDEESPISVSQVMSLGTEAETALNGCITATDKHEIREALKPLRA